MHQEAQGPEQQRAISGQKPERGAEQPPTLHLQAGKAGWDLGELEENVDGPELFLQIQDAHKSIVTAIHRACVHRKLPFLCEYLPALI